MTTSHLITMGALVFFVGMSFLHAEDWTTTDGKTYKNAQVTSHNSSVVTISYSDGNATFAISLLNKDIQQRIINDNVTSTEWTTSDGKLYKNVKVLKQDETSVTILYDDGGAVIPLANLPDDLKKKFNYDPVKIQAENEQKADEEQAATAAKAAKEEADQAAYIKSITKTLREVDTDKVSFVGQKFVFEGTIALDTYYNWGYENAQETHYSFKVEQGNVSAAAYMLKSDSKADNLRKKLLAVDGSLKGKFLVEIEPARFEKEGSGLLLLLLDYYPPDDTDTPEGDK